MALILNIDTATEIAIVSLAENEKVLLSVVNKNQKDHAAFLQPAIKDLLKNTEISFAKINAVAVTAGPGSYTGLRVGMASAKGLCYALNIPMLLVNTLEVMALSSINTIKDQKALYCPMIDARRMEVFTAVYNFNLQEIIPPCSMILDETSCKEILHLNKVYFSGSGAAKTNKILNNENAFFSDKEITPDAMPIISFKKFINKEFENIATAAPFYLKEFHTNSPL